MKFKTKQAEIDWLRAELKVHQEELKEINSVSRLVEREKESALDALRAINTVLWDIRQWNDPEGIEKLVDALVKNHQSYTQLIHTNRAAAERVVKEADKLKSSLMFVARCTCEREGTSYTSISKSLMISIEDVMRAACKEIDSLIAGSRGLVNGCQDSHYRNHVAEYLEKQGEPT